MKKIGLVILSILFPLLAWSQQTEYNRKGDEAMKRQDYSDARLWYGEGVTNCDMYSITQLTDIWKENEQMRVSMRSLMSKCLNCLTIKANENDTTAMSQLIFYYTEGVGTPKNKELTSYWSRQLRNAHRKENTTIETSTPRTPIEKEFFVGYNYSLEAPVGITVGAVFNNIGGYVRFKTNLNFDSPGNIYREDGVDGITGPHKYLEKKVSYYAATAGVVLKWTPWLYTSIGAGYFDRQLLYRFENIDDNGAPVSSLWSKNVNDSNKGITAEIDFTARFGKYFYVSAGCNTLSFKYIDMNAGVGVFF